MGTVQNIFSLRRPEQCVCAFYTLKDHYLNVLLNHLTLICIVDNDNTEVYIIDTNGALRSL